MKRGAKALATAGVVLGAALAPGCRREPESGHAGPSAPARASSQVESERVYHFRGRVVKLPPPVGQARYLVVHHERVDPFFDRAGTNVGMNEMTMEFPWLGEGVPLAGLAPGDAVEFDVGVLWSRTNAYVVRRIAKLPADAVLDLKNSEGD